MNAETILISSAFESKLTSGDITQVPLNKFPLHNHSEAALGLPMTTVFNLR